MKRYKILIIDDDRDVCEVLCRNLAEDGYETDSALTGNEGVEKAKRGACDLVILDLKLPDIDGTEVLKRIRSFNRKVPIIILTGYPSLETAIGTFKNQVSDYLLKPFNTDQLRAVIRRELEEKGSELTTMPEIGKKIKQLRKDKKLSLDALADKTGLSKSFLSEVERQKKFPRLDTVQNIANALDVTVHFFFGK